MQFVIILVTAQTIISQIMLIIRSIIVLRNTQSAPIVRIARGCDVTTVCCQLHAPPNLSHNIAVQAALHQLYMSCAAKCLGVHGINIRARCQCPRSTSHHRSLGSMLIPFFSLCIVSPFPCCPLYILCLMLFYHVPSSLFLLFPSPSASPPFHVLFRFLFLPLSFFSALSLCCVAVSMVLGIAAYTYIHISACLSSCIS